MSHLLISLDSDEEDCKLNVKNEFQSIDLPVSDKLIAQCNMCGEMFNSTVPFVSHLQSIHNIKNLFECTLCHQIFNCEKGLEHHTAIEHQNKNNFKQNILYPCQVCGESFFLVEALHKHKEIHTTPSIHSSVKESQSTEPTFQCSECDKSFFTEKTLSWHKAKKHVAPEKRTKSKVPEFLCTLCDKKFDRKYILNAHLIIDHQNRPKAVGRPVTKPVRKSSRKVPSQPKSDLSNPVVIKSPVETIKGGGRHEIIASAALQKSNLRQKIRNIPNNADEQMNDPNMVGAESKGCPSIISDQPDLVTCHNPVKTRETKKKRGLNKRTVRKLILDHINSENSADLFRSERDIRRASQKVFAPPPKNSNVNLTSVDEVNQEIFSNNTLDEPSLKQQAPNELVPLLKNPSVDSPFLNQSVCQEAILRQTESSSVIFAPSALPQATSHESALIQLASVQSTSLSTLPHLSSSLQPSSSFQPNTLTPAFPPSASPQSISSPSTSLMSVTPSVTCQSVIPSSILSSSAHQPVPYQAISRKIVLRSTSSYLPAPKVSSNNSLTLNQTSQSIFNVPCSKQLVLSSVAHQLISQPSVPICSSESQSESNEVFSKGKELIGNPSVIVESPVKQILGSNLTISHSCLSQVAENEAYEKQEIAIGQCKQVNKKKLDSSESYSCKLCDTNFEFWHQFLLHVEIHKLEKADSCSTCLKPFSLKYNLMNHNLMEHYVDPLFSCPACEKLFQLWSDCKKHVLSSLCHDRLS